MARSIGVAVGSFSDPTEERLTFARQIGCTGVTVNTPNIPGSARWEVDDLVTLRQRCESFGLELVGIENTPLSFYDKAMLGLPGRDEQIENYRTTIRNLGRAGIGLLGYHWMPNGVWRTSRTTYGRGGSRATSFDLALVDQGSLVYGFSNGEITQHYMTPADGSAPTHGRVYTEEEMWDSFRYFMHAVLPVAAEHDVRLALHPDDPPVEQLGGIPRPMRDRRGIDAALEIGDSPHHGLIFCVGTWAEMGADVVETARHFGAAQRIFLCHFRDVKGVSPQFRECFLGEGDVDFVGVVRALKEVGYRGFVIDDHVPAMIDDTPWGHRGRAVSTGYISALIDAVGSDRSPGATSVPRT